jgi:hypothetical protein
MKLHSLSLFEIPQLTSATGRAWPQVRTLNIINGNKSHGLRIERFFPGLHELDFRDAPLRS